MIVPGIILTVIGALLIIAFISSRARCTTAVEAEIVKINGKKHYYRGRTVWDCTPEFTYTVNNKEYTAKSDHSTSNPKKYFVGQKITVYTDARHPERVRDGSNVGFCIAGVVIAALGIFFIVLSVM